MDNIDQFDQFFKNSHYNIVRSLLSVSGLWPFHTLRRRCAIYLAMILVLGSGFTFEVLGVMDIWHDSFEVIDALPLLFFPVVNMIKMIYAVYTLQNIKLLLINMQEYCLSPKSDKETKIYNSHALYGQKFGYIYTGLVLCHPIIFQSLTLMTRLINKKENEEKNASSTEAQGAQIGLSYHVNYMVDIDTYYVPIFIHTAICEMSYTFLIVVFDVLYIISIEHCCGLFESLRYRLENAFNFENNNNNLTFTKNLSYSNIVYSIQRHTETMQFIVIMKSVYSLPLFIQVGYLVLALSIVGFQIITNTENINQVIKHTAYMNVLLINIFFENWQGQKIIDSSEKVFESAYNAEWYNMPVATRKLLIMIMMTSKKPLMLTIGKFFALSYITFNAVIRTSSSYFMLLRSVQ
ncbi:uncharacterized protein LOC115241609 [Formica exsecta]|uniref:uncharacterized protein LOC115241609 n=1 Tax=Formica exsecta TaxID=72781 RepID=UPI001143ED4C|nr:uncharacterized protein LOC115241609 [Formica exsecta]